MAFEIMMETRQEVEERFYKLREDIQTQIRAYKSLRAMCVDESQFSCIDRLDKGLEVFEKLNKDISENPIVTEKDLKKWRKALDDLVGNLIKIYREHKQWQIKERVAAI